MSRALEAPLAPAGASPPRYRWHGSSYGYAVLLLLVVAVATVPRIAHLTAPISGMDEALLLVYPEQLRAGRLPNRDFFTVYGPGNFAFLAAIFELTGPKLVTLRLVALAYQVAIVTGVMFLVRRHGRGAAVVAGGVSGLVLLAMSLLASSWMGGLALAVWSLALLTRRGTTSAFVAGVLAGLSASWRIEMVVLQAASLPLLWRHPARTAYLAGAVIGGVPALLHLVFARRSVLDNVFLERLGLDAQLDRSLLTPGVWIMLVLLVAAVLLCVVRAARTRDHHDLSAAILSVLLLPQALQRIDHAHLAMVACVVVPLAVAPLVGRLRLRGPGARMRAQVAAVTVLASLAAALTAVGTAPTGPSVRVAHGGRSIYASPADAEIADRVLRAVRDNVAPGSRVFMGSQDMSRPTGSPVAFYHLLPDYSSEFYYLELPPGVAERRGSPLVADIESADALVLVDVPDSVARLQYPGFGLGVQDANRAVRRGFCRAVELPSAALYLRKGRC